MEKWSICAPMPLKSYNFGGKTHISTASTCWKRHYVFRLRYEH